MTARALMETAWGGVPSDMNGADDAYVQNWSAEEFGARAAGAVTDIYKEYFAAPAVRSRQGAPGLTSAGNAAPAPPPQSMIKRPFGDQHYHSEIRRLILDALTENQVIAVPSQSPKWTEPHVLPQPGEEERGALIKRDIEECEEAQARWDALWKHALAVRDLVDPGRRDYYQAAVLTMISINRESNRALLLVAQAVQDVAAGDRIKAHEEAESALAALDAAEQSMGAAEYGKWKNWYRGDWLTGVYRTRELVSAYADHLDDPLARLPAPAAWTGWEAYFHIMEYEGDRSVDVH
jgi:hypothetical protein